jgi:hypothetical protein
MKIAVCVPPAACDGYGHLTRYAEKIAEIGAERSVEVEILKFVDDDFLARLFANLMDEDCIVHFHCFLYDLKIHTSPASKSVQHALDICRARTIATVSDHPFSDFMEDMVRNAHPSTRFIVIDDTFPDEMRFINPSLRQAHFSHLPFVPPLSFESRRCIDFDRREYDLVLPLLVVDTSKLDLTTFIGLRAQDWFARAVMATYEIVRHDLSQNPFHVFANCMRAEIDAGPDDLMCHHPQAVPGLLRTLSRLDGYVRQERRAKVIGSLLRRVGDLKVAVLGDPVAGLAIDDNVRFVGHQQARDTANLMANSRAVLNCSPSYPGNVHERVTVGMLYESCVITDTNPCLEETFSADEFVNYGPESEMTIEDVFAAYDTRAIANRSAQKARDNPRFSWDGHFDAIMDIALA